jgi:hypothetical protein
VGAAVSAVTLLFWVAVLLLVVYTQNIVLAIVAEAYEEAKAKLGTAETSFFMLVLMRLLFFFLYVAYRIRMFCSDVFRVLTGGKLLSPDQGSCTAGRASSTRSGPAGGPQDHNGGDSGGGGGNGHGNGGGGVVSLGRATTHDSSWTVDDLGLCGNGVPSGLQSSASVSGTDYKSTQAGTRVLALLECTGYSIGYSIVLLVLCCMTLPLRCAQKCAACVIFFSSRDVLMWYELNNICYKLSLGHLQL